MDSGAGPESSGDSGSFDGSPVDNQSPSRNVGGGQSSNGQAPTGINPAWTAALEGVPNEFHKNLQEHFGRWDQNYQKLAQQYTPYKSFADQRISPQELQQAWQLRGLLDQNPHEVLRRLSTALGVKIAQEQQEQEQQSSQEPDGEPEDPRWAELNRRQEMLNQQNQQVLNYVQQRAHQEEVQAAEQEVGQEIEQLKQRHGDFDVVDVLQRASLMDEPNIELAFQQQQQFLQREFQRTRSTANYRAPLVSPTSGGMPPSAEKNPAQYTRAERTAAFGALLQAHNERG